MRTSRDRDAAIARASGSSYCGPPGSRFGGAARRCPQFRGGDQEDLAQQSAGDAMVAILSKLDQFPRPEQIHDLGVQIRSL